VLEFAIDSHDLDAEKVGIGLGLGSAIDV